MITRLNEYQSVAAQTAVYPPSAGQGYTVLGLASEAGEVAGAFKKFLRGDFSRGELNRRMKKELGGVFWYLAMAAKEFGFTLQDIANENAQQLASRQERSVLRGDGDDR